MSKFSKMSFSCIIGVRWGDNSWAFYFYAVSQSLPKCDLCLVFFPPFLIISLGTGRWPRLRILAAASQQQSGLAGSRVKTPPCPQLQWPLETAAWAAPGRQSPGLLCPPAAARVEPDSLGGAPSARVGQVLGDTWASGSGRESFRLLQSSPPRRPFIFSVWPEVHTKKTNDPCKKATGICGTKEF